MKKYFFFIIFSMLAFTGYIFIKRPGNSINLSIPVLLKKNPPTVAKGGYPQFVFISGDVLVLAKGTTYGARNEYALHEGDEVFVNSRSKAILKLGEEQYILLNEGTKIVLQRKLKRQKGLTELFLKRGQILVDFFKGKKPVGIKIESSLGYTFSQDATFRMEIKDGETRIANDRNTLLLIHTRAQKEGQVEQGEGAIFDETQIKTGRYSWVDNYPWEKEINALSLRGIGRRAVLTPPGLDTRIKDIKEPHHFKKTTSPTHNISQNKNVKKVFESIKKSASGLTQISENIKKSNDAIKAFKEKQKANKEILDSL